MRLILLALCCLSLPAMAESDKDIARLIALFSDDEQAMAALDKVIAIGDPAVAQLEGLALEKQDVVARGWAIAALGYIGTDAAIATLKKLGDDPAESNLIRTWAKAARIEAAKSFAELRLLARDLARFPALLRPLQKKMVTQTKSASTRDLLLLASSNPQLQSVLTAPILARSVDELQKAMLTSSDNDVRRMAAAYLGTKAQKGETQEVVSGLVSALSFRKGSRVVPWRGGALFLPALKYEREQARALVEELITWHLFCDVNGLKAEQQQIHNNIRGVGLARMGNYRAPGWREVGTKEWLKIWAEAVGKKRVLALIDKVGAPSSYKKVLP